MELTATELRILADALENLEWFHKEHGVSVVGEIAFGGTIYGTVDYDSNGELCYLPKIGP